MIALPEMHQPGRLPVPLAQAFAGHLEVVAHVGMEDQRQSHKSAGHDVVGKIRGAIAHVAVFVGGKNAGLRFRDRSHIIELAGFLRDRMAGLIELFVKQVFDGGKARNVVTISFTRSPEAFRTSCAGQATPAATPGVTSSTPGGPHALSGREGGAAVSARSLSVLISVMPVSEVSRFSSSEITDSTCGFAGLFGSPCRNVFNARIAS